MAERELNRSERATIRKLVTELCANYDSQDRIRTYRYKAFYSLDRDEGIEREILQKPLNPAEIWEQRQMTELIYKGLSKLPVKQRQRIYAHFFLGMSKADIAKAEGTHKSRITRSIEAGLRSLEKYFKEIL